GGVPPGASPAGGGRGRAGRACPGRPRHTTVADDPRRRTAHRRGGGRPPGRAAAGPERQAGLRLRGAGAPAVPVRGSDRRGRITRRGPALLRKLLVECAWAMPRYNARARETYARLTRAGTTRKKQAVVALARRLLVRCWAMLRDRAPW